MPRLRRTAEKSWCQYRPRRISRGHTMQLPQALTARKCRFEEKQQGVIINGDTGQPATPNDPCIERGVTIAYSAEATHAARKDVIEFLSKLFNK
jgi:hypothetical protein